MEGCVGYRVIDSQVTEKTHRQGREAAGASIVVYH